MTSTVRKILKLSLFALFLKMASAPLSYFMFVILAQSMSTAAYGAFAFSFSIATVLGKVAVIGQQQSLLAVLPPLDDAGDTPRWRGATTFSLRLVLAGGIGLAIGLLTVSFLWGGTHKEALISAALLVPLLAISEFQSSVIRTKGSIFWALAPREIMWRSSIIFVAILTIFGFLPNITAFGWMVVMCALFVPALILQATAIPATRYWSSLAGNKSFDSSAWISMAKSFWLTTVVTFITPNIAVVLIGVVLDPIKSGPFFAALKTAQLMTLFLLASNIVATPLLSKYWARNDQQAIQRVCATVATSAGIFSVTALSIVVLFGDRLLLVFGEGFQEATPELILMSIGFAFSALNGPNGALLQMAGLQAKFAKIMLITGGLSLALLIPATIFGGTFGAAAAILFSTVSWNLWGWFECRKQLKIDTSVLGALKLISR